MRSNSLAADFQSLRPSASSPMVNRSSISRWVAIARSAGRLVVRGAGLCVGYDSASVGAVAIWVRRATSVRTRMAYWVAGSAGRPAWDDDAAVAARSGLHSHPIRPAEVIGPSSAGDAEGVSAPSSIACSEVAPASAKRPDHAKAAMRAKTASKRRRWDFDTTFIIAESLKNR